MISKKNRTLQAGDIMVERGTALPPGPMVESNSATGWVSLAKHLNGRQLDEDIARAGWTLLYLAGSIRIHSYGFEREKMVSAALKQVIARVKLLRCNCLQIDDVTMHSFMGMPYVSVSAHSLNIQESRAS
jgi:hypothetical protein